MSYTCSCRNIHIYAGYILTQWITDARRKTSLTIFTSHFIARVRKGCVRFYCERELEIEHNSNILTPHSYGRHVVSFLFSWCSTGGLGAHSAGWSATSYQQLLRSQNRSGFSRPPEAGCGFPYHISSPTVWNSTGNTTGPLGVEFNWNRNSIQLARRTQLSYIIVQRPLDLWNRMFNRHQAEITIMQFRGHSLPVHHSVVYHGNFLAHPISSANFRPCDILS